MARHRLRILVLSIFKWPLKTGFTVILWIKIETTKWFIYSIYTLENHRTRTAQSLHGGCSWRVHKIVYLAVDKGNILVTFLLLKIFIWIIITYSAPSKHSPVVVEHPKCCSTIQWNTRLAFVSLTPCILKISWTWSHVLKVKSNPYNNIEEQRLCIMSIWYENFQHTSKPKKLDESISNFRVVGWYFSYLFIF